jgi:hypothetical protein
VVQYDAQRVEQEGDVTAFMNLFYKHRSITVAKYGLVRDRFVRAAFGLSSMSSYSRITFFSPKHLQWHLGCFCRCSRSSQVCIQASVDQNTRLIALQRLIG